MDKPKEKTRISVDQLKKRWHFQTRGKQLVFDTRFPKPTTPRGKRRNQNPTFPSWAFQPKFVHNGTKWVPGPSPHLIIVNIG